MKRTNSPFYARRTFILSLLSFVAVAAVVSFGVSARRASRQAALQATKESVSPYLASVPKSVSVVNKADDKNPNVPNLASITATLTDNLAPATQVAPGGTITYLAEITNGGATSPGDDATALAYNANLANTTSLVPGSLHSSPMARNDSYTTVGNTLLEVGVAATGNPAVAVSGSLFDNDISPATAPDTYSLESFQATSANGGTVSVNANGTFTYLPPVGSTATDTFTYTLRNNAATTPVLTNSATVTITVGAPLVWYVNNSGPNGDGRSTSPFSSLTPVNGAGGAGDPDAANSIIYVFTGGGNYTTGLVMESGQQLIGNGVALIVNAFTLRGSGSRPTIANSAGNGVTLSSNNTLRGFNVGDSNTATGYDVANTPTATVGTLNIDNVGLGGSGGLFRADSGGALTVSFDSASTTSAGLNGIQLTNVTGTFSAGAAGNLITGVTGTDVFVSGGSASVNVTSDIASSAGGSIEVASHTGTNGITFSGDLNITGGTGISVHDNSGAKTIAFTNGDKDISTGATAAVSLANNTGVTINFSGGGLDIDTTGGAGFSATGGGTISVTTGASPNTINTGSGTALNVANTTIGASDLTFQLISANGGTNGILLNNTGSSGGLIVAANGGTCTSSGTCTGGAIENQTGAGISLTNTQQVSIDRMFIQNTGQSGVGGTQVVDFSFTNGKIHNSGTSYPANSNNDSNIGFGFDSLTTENNVSGVVTITGNTLTNATQHGVDIQNFAGTISNATISSNTITSTNSSGTSHGSGIRLLGFGNASSSSNITKATIASNTITNFPGGAGITAQYGNNTSGPAGAWGTPGSGTNRIFIQSNLIKGESAVNPMNTNAILMTLTGKGQANWLADGNGTVANPITNIGGAVIGVTIRGVNPVATCDITNNRIVGITNVAAQGIAYAADFSTLVSDAPQLTGSITGNNISNQDGQPIQVLATAGSTAHINVAVKNNVTTAPNCGGCNRFGITAEVGSSSGTVTGNPSMCLDMSGNTAAGSGVNPGIGIRKKTAAYVFNIEGFAGGGDPTAFLTGLNPAGGGVIMINQTTGFGNCSSAPAMAPPNEEAMNAAPLPTTPAAVASQFEVPAVVAEVPAANTNLANDVVAPALTNLNPSGDAKAVQTFHHAQFSRSRSIRSSVADKNPLDPQSGDPVSLTVGTLPAGETVQILYQATVDTPPTARQATHQGSVTYVGGPGSPLLTDDPDVVGTANPTVTAIDVLMTWNGSASTDWNTATNWTQPVGGTQYVPGGTNPAVNDVVIPAGVLANEPTISAANPDIGIFSLNIAAGRTLTIDPTRKLTIGAPAPGVGGDLTLNGLITGGELRFGTGSHVITVGTGSLSSTNLMRVLSGSTVTLNNNLQAGALAIDSGGTLTITNRTLTLTGAGLALSNSGTLTAGGDTVVFQGAAAQSASGTLGFNHLTISNAAGVTFLSSFSVGGTLALTTGDITMSGTFILNQPNTTPSTGNGDVIGTLRRSGGPFAAATLLTFGNANNQITFTGAGTRPSQIDVTLVKAAPSSYLGAVQRNYTIAPAGGSGYSATLRLHYLDSELNNNIEANLNLRKLEGTWRAQLPSVVDVTNNWVECNAVSAFSQWTFSSLTPTAADGTVTGRIVDDNGAAVEGAVVVLSGAQNRKFITDANGFYRFENVETGGFYVVTPARVNYTFSPSAISFSQIGETTEAAFGATATGGTANPLDTPEYFVRQHYLDFLGREPDEAGFNFWSDQILECGDDTDCVDRRTTNVSAAYFLSIEFQETGGLVDGLYRASYGRRPGYGEFKPDAAAVAPTLVVGNDGWQGTLENGKAAFVNAFVQRAAFQTVYGSLSNDAYVDTLIANTGVSFTASERDSLVSGLGSGGMTRATVLRAVAENGQFRAAKRNEAFVMMEYFGYLRREPDAGGYQFWLNKLNEFNGNFEQAEMVKSFIVSGEYRERFPR